MHFRPTPRLLLAPLLVLASACVDEPLDEEQNDGDGSSIDALLCSKCDRGGRSEFVGDGAYTVPVAADAPTSVLDASTNAVIDVRIRVRSGEIELSYDLPLELTGTPVEVEFTSAVPTTGSELVLTGVAGTATCSLRDAKSGFGIFCDEALPGVVVDPAAVEALLLARGESIETINAHVELSVIFQEDPIGFLDAELSAKRDDD